MTERRRRIKPVICILCKTEKTYDINSICGDCKSIYRDGILYRQKLERGEVTEWPIEINWQFYHWLGECGNGWETFDRIRHAVMNLAGVNEVESRHWFSSEFISDERREIIGGNPDKREPNYHLFSGPLDVFEQMIELVRAIRDYGADQYADGLEKGHQFLNDLSTGRLSMEDLYKHEARIAAEMQGRLPAGAQGYETGAGDGRVK